MSPTAGRISTRSEEETIIKAKQTDFRSAAPMWAALSVAVIWLALIAATAYEDGMTLIPFMDAFAGRLDHPFALRWTPHTPRFILGTLAAYAIGIMLYYGEREHKRPGEEHDGAAWGSASFSTVT